MFNWTKAEEPPRLSVVVCIYNMQREAPRTLYSLSSIYQRGVEASDYEVIVVENGSPEPLSSASIEELGSNFRYFFLDDASSSPARAINFGVSEAKGEHVGLMIDGARLVTPGLLRLALGALATFPRPVVSSLGFHLGPETQARSQMGGYNRRVEDDLLASINWPHEGYRLFEIAALAESSRFGWFQPIAESNCVFMPGKLFDELGGFEEAFAAPAGGLVNLDFYYRACQLPDSHLVMLLGEGSFHQIHSSAITNRTPNERDRLWTARNTEYRRIRGVPFTLPERKAIFVGDVPAPAVPWIRKSCDLFAAQVKNEPGG